MFDINSIMKLNNLIDRAEENIEKIKNTDYGNNFYLSYKKLDGLLLLMK